MVYCDVIKLNDDLFKVWVNYKNYSTAEACVILGVTASAFKKALERHGVDKYRVKPKKPKPDPVIKLPRSKEEFEALHEKHGVAKIAQMTGLSRSKITNMKYKHGLTSPRDKFIGGENECNNIEWLKEHYVKQKMSMRKCAKLAKVSLCTIRNWLISHGIVPRPKTVKNATLQAGIP